MGTSIRFAPLVALGLGSIASGQCPEQRLTSSVPDFAHFGRDLAVSGSTLLVGSVEAQAAFVFEQTGSAWQQTARLDNPTPEADSFYGAAVGISGDTAIVSDARPSDPGRLHVFVRSGGVWTWEATLQPTDGAPFDYFSSSLAIDGDTIVARKHVGFQSTVHVYERTGTSWQETQQLAGPPLTFFGSGLALEGDTLAVGDIGDFTEGYNAGACTFFRRVGGVWTPEDYVLPVTGEHTYFGTSVALDGDTAVVGATAYLAPGEPGSAYVYERSGSQWQFTQRLLGLGCPSTSPFGLQVSVRGDRILVSAPGDEASDVSGAAYVFERSGGEWRQSAELRPPTGDDGFDLFGYSVEQLGREAFVGSPGEGSGIETGQVYVFDMTASTPISYCQSTLNSTGLAAEIASVGSHLVPVDDMTLIARNVPDEMGLFFMGQQTTRIPFWDGFLCVAPPLVRLPVVTASSNQLVHFPDLSALPITVLPGSTWHFQAWFRDPAAGGTGANLSNGISVPFCP